jgi:hypothetical protein
MNYERLEYDLDEREVLIMALESVVDTDFGGHIQSLLNRVKTNDAFIEINEIQCEQIMIAFRKKFSYDQMVTRGPLHSEDHMFQKLSIISNIFAAQRHERINARNLESERAKNRFLNLLKGY